MPNWLVNRINNTFGSNITHVTNAYSRSEFVWLIFHSEELSIEEVEIEIEIQTKSGKGKVKARPKQIKQTLRLPFKEIHVQRRTSPEEFLTVVTPRGEEACNNFQIPANRSYIVTNRFQVKESQYGGDVWVDNQGVNHKPR